MQKHMHTSPHQSQLITTGLASLQGNESRKSEPDAAETAAQEAAVPAAQLASWKTMNWREQVEEQASAGDVASTSQPATAAAERLAVIPAPVTPALERMLQVTHSSILGATFVQCT